MSIRPEYAARILRGEKRVEFRRTRMSEDVSHVVIYATAPLRVLVGVFEVCGVDEATPEVLWERYAPIGGIDEDAFRAYFCSTSQWVAIRVGDVFELESPVGLGEIAPNVSAPQSYRYVGEEVLNRALSLARKPV